VHGAAAKEAGRHKEAKGALTGEGEPNAIMCMTQPQKKQVGIRLRWA